MNRRRNRATPQQAGGTLPRARQVVPGARVAIVLKADQASGRESIGVVGEVLTRGEQHPRGIKVRLRDGRVGRVQRMDEGGQAVSRVRAEDVQRRPEDQVEGLQRRPEDQVEARGGTQKQQEDHVGPLQKRQEQAESVQATHRQSSEPTPRNKTADQDLPPRGLVDFVPAWPPEQTPPYIATPPKQTPYIATCPVCEAFQGDEAAVTHHVETCHFATI